MKSNANNRGWRKVMCLCKKGTLATCAMLLISGCYSFTLEEGRAMMAKYDINVENLGSAKVPDRTIMPLEAEALIGTWTGEYEILDVMTHLGSNGMYEFRSKVDVSYTFRDDGTFTYVSKTKDKYQGQYHESGRDEGNGTWRYSNGALDLIESGEHVFQYSDTKRCERLYPYAELERKLQVYWLNENEIAVRYRTPGDLVNASLAKSMRYGSDRYRRIWAGYDKKDGRKVELWFWTSNINATKGQHSAKKTKQSNFHRVGVRVKSSVAARQVEAATGMSRPIEAASRQQAKDAAELAHKPPYRLIDLAREENSDFAYTFSLELTSDTSIQTFFGVQNVFANEVRTAYQMEYPNADASSLRVVVQPRLSNGRIVGRAEVLTITPVALSYDVGTRLGRLSVRFGANQYEEARKWIRKNIETLARDKNIALVTGEIPPAAKFYLGREELKDGNVLEIEFKTE